MSSDAAASLGETKGPERAVHDQVRISDLAVGVIIGRTSEYFDFFVYAIASVVVFPALFFPHLDKVTGTVWSFAIFALAFVARPVGTAIFNPVERLYGRATKLTIALFLLGGSTVMMAFLPGYSQIGLWGAALLALLRIAQGVALGGTWDGLATLLAVNAPKDKQGTYAMIPQLGVPFGLIVASILFDFFHGYLSPRDFLDWGWRYPFFVAFAINVVALFARLRMVATQEYADMFERRELQPSGIGETIRAEGRDVLIGALAPLATFALFHMVTVFPLTWVVLYTGQDLTWFLIVELIGALFGSLAMIASGPIADQFGRRNVLSIMTIFIGAFAIFAPPLLYAGEPGVAAFMILGSILLGLAFGQSSGTLARNFEMKYRYTGSALTADLAWLFGAGFAPLVALLITENLGLLASGLYLLSGAICSGIVLFIDRRQGARQK